MALFAKFHIKQKTCYEFAYKQIFTKLLGLANIVNKYKQKEEEDKEYVNNIFKKNSYMDNQLIEFFNDYSILNEFRPAELVEFRGVTKDLREIRQDIEMKATGIT